MLCESGGGRYMIEILFENEDILAVNKPEGLASIRERQHPNPRESLFEMLCAQRGERLYVVHRIDKDTSGLLVVAKSDAAHEGLAKQFADHSIERAYLALVGGHPAPREGTIRGRIGRSDANRKKMAVLAATSNRGKHATTHYKTLKTMPDCTLVECRLETGRTHQVRVHLASIGHALLGDPAYGRTNPRLRPILRKIGFDRQALHAAVLGFIHPVSGEKMRFESQLPADMRELIDETAH